MSFEMNKILGALLGAMILAMVSGIVANILVHPTQLAKPAYLVAGVQETATTTAAPEEAKIEPVEPLLAQASIDAGKADTQRLCIACHTFEKGGPNRIGPNLYGIFDDEIANGRGGYAFSAALSSHKGKWTADQLNEWLDNPQQMAPGTKMTFVGLPKVRDRADVIDYLDSLSDHPEPLPTAAPPTAAAGPGKAPAPATAAPPASAAQKASPAVTPAAPAPGSAAAPAPAPAKAPTAAATPPAAAPAKESAAPGPQNSNPAGNQGSGNADTGGQK
jgi:cytochrome c